MAAKINWRIIIGTKGLLSGIPDFKRLIERDSSSKRQAIRRSAISAYG